MIHLNWLLVIAVISLVGCGKNIKSVTEPESVLESRAIFQEVKKVSRQAVHLSKLCEEAYRLRTTGWAETCIKSNDQFMKLTLLRSDYLNAGIRLSSWGATILQARVPDLQGSDELSRFMDDVQFFTDRADDARKFRTIPRCLNGIFSEYGSLVPNGCCDFYKENLKPLLADRFCSSHHAQ